MRLQLLFSIFFISLLFGSDHKQPVFCFDIHGVMVNSGIKQIIKSFWYLPEKIKLLRLLLSSDFRRDFKIIHDETHIAEITFDRLSEKYPLLKQYDDIFYQLANGTINKEMLKLLQDLKQNNYSLCIATNSGPKTYRDFSMRHPELASLFETVIMPYETKKLVTDPITGQIKTVIDFVAKPSPLYYKHLRERITEKFGPTSKIIFIDNDKTNTKEAENVFAQTGDEVIYFTSTKKLRSNLRKYLNILS